MIDLSKLPAPKIIEELSFEAILREMREDFAGRCPGWTAEALESDPANKILEVASYRELLLRQRINEAARACMLALSTGSDLEHLAAFYAVERLAGAQATFGCRITLSAALAQDITIPAGFTVTDSAGNTAQLRADVTIAAGATTAAGTMEMIYPAGAAGNGITSAWSAITPLPWVTSILQLAEAAGGSDAESDDRLRLRTQQSPESWSTAGPDGAYEYWPYTADSRVADVKVSSPTPGNVRVVVLSSEGNGAADQTMLDRVTAILSAEKHRPLTDNVQVVSATPLAYTITAHLNIYSGVSAEPVIEAATEALEALAAAKRGIGTQITVSMLIAAAHVEGVRKVGITSPAADVEPAADEAPYCTNVAITWSIDDDD
ncbi:MAG: baseplate J/gp47 family protein [Synergistaceae bacterium]|nr:baseplate J/gp47 family protein [Synergistaceae bacterium]